MWENMGNREEYYREVFESRSMNKGEPSKKINNMTGGEKRTNQLIRKWW